jgi:hypothetical protein
MINCCCQGEKYKKKMFFKQWLEIKPAKAPDIINWENLATTRSERCFRILFTTVVSLVLIVATFILLIVS